MKVLIEVDVSEIKNIERLRNSCPKDVSLSERIEI
jgi:hypothetical protein